MANVERVDEEEEAVVVVEAPVSAPPPLEDFEVLPVAAGSFVAEVSLVTVLELSSAPPPE